MKNYAGETVELVHNMKHQSYGPGDPVRDSRGAEGLIISLAPPHKPGSTGKVCVRWASGFVHEVYPSVIGCTFRQI